MTKADGRRVALFFELFTTHLHEHYTLTTGLYSEKIIPAVAQHLCGIRSGRSGPCRFRLERADLFAIHNQATQETDRNRDPQTTDTITPEQPVSAPRGVCYLLLV